jgi:hypothetical protein
MEPTRRALRSLHRKTILHRAVNLPDVAPCNETYQMLQMAFENKWVYKDNPNLPKIISY